MKQMVKKNPLLDEIFLQQLYLDRHKEIYAKIIALNQEEEPIEQIEGQVTGGSVSLDGSSNVRRSCNLTMVTNNIDINAYYWGIKNKFKLFIGLNNIIDKTYDDIIWFPFGVMVITNFSTSLSTSGYNISISGKDKMCLLNGELSGSLFASVDFGKIEEYDTKTGVTTMSDIPIKDIVRDAVHDYAQEPWENIIINDLTDYGLELLDYKGNKPLYLIISEEANGNVFLGDVVQITLNGDMSIGGTPLNSIQRYNQRTKLDFADAIIDDYDIFQWPMKDPITKEQIIIPVSVAKIEYGQTCGYRYTDITYAGDLILGIGEPITAMLDKLVQMLGNWEYFYDVDGRFIFQRKKTYLDKTWNNIITNNDDSYIPTSGETYAESVAWSSAVSWNFTDSFLITAFNNTPVLNNVRNDYSIWGTKQSISGTELPVHLRYAIDKKPTYYKTIDGQVFLTNDEIQTRMSPFRTHLAKNMGTNWWEVSDWARQYLYVTDTTERYSMQDYLNLTPQDITNLLREETENQYWINLRDKKLNDFWTAYIAKEDVLKIFTDENSRNKIRYYPYLFLFDTKLDINGEETIAYASHNPSTSSFSGTDIAPHSCSHTYGQLLNAYAVNNYQYSYIYMPLFPETSRTEETAESIDYIDLLNSAIMCDWREIIFQMAKDYRRYARYNARDMENFTDEEVIEKFGHSREELLNIAENFANVIRENNGKDAQGEWRYPTGMTGYEQYYVDLEGFWRQLYCPPKLLYDWVNTGVWTDRYAGMNIASVVQADETVTVELNNFAKTNILYFLSTDWIGNGDASKDGWNKGIIDSPATLNFWFDFLDADKDSDFAKYSVPVIGDRAKSVNDNMVKAIYFREVPNTIFTKDLLHTQRKSGYTYMQYQENMSNLFTISTQGKCAIDVMEEWINNYIYAIESTSITTIPIYHLQPNTRIKIMDKNSHINGDYIVSRISIPLAYNGTMSITATKVADRVY